MVDNITVQSLVEALQPKDKSKPSTFAAVVTKKDKDGTAWVQIAGSEIETPIEASTADVKSGDAVTVEWRNNRLYIAGNTSNPSAGVEAVGTVERKAVSAQQAAENASRIAGNTNQYFWHTETGTDTGAHITEVPREDFLADPTNGGGNLLARSNGIAVRDGLTELATFGASGAVIGKIGEQRIRQIATGLEFIDENDAIIAFITLDNNEVEIRNGYHNYKVVIGNNGVSVVGSQGEIITADVSGVFIKDHTNTTGAIGHFSSGSGTNSSFSTGNSLTQINAPIKFTAGTWLIIGDVVYPNDTNGSRCAEWRSGATSSSLASINASRVVVGTASSGFSTRIQTVATVQSNADIYLSMYGYMYTGSSATISVDWYWRAIRIA